MDSTLHALHANFKSFLKTEKIKKLKKIKNEFLKKFIKQRGERGAWSYQ
jgi:hypothetical protein